MIELVKVELKNFRSFGSAVFTPLNIGQGLTAINGPNGMGKSSIVHAIVWAMYGVTPDGVRVGALRRQGSEGDGDVEVKVTFTYDGQEIIVTRALRGKNDTTIASIELDGVEQTNVSSRTASQWITRHIGLDAEAFLIAFVVRQKELDNLVKARPAERRKIIERLAGIERMSKGLELARSQAREAQKTFDGLPEAVNPSDLSSILEEQNNKLSRSEEKLLKAREEVVKAESHKQEVANKIAQSRKNSEERQTAQHAIDLLDARLEDLEQQVVSLEKKSSYKGDLDSAKSELAEVLEEQASIKTSQESIRELNEALSNAEALLAQAREQEEFWLGRVGNTRKSIAESNTKIEDLESTTQSQTQDEIIGLIDEQQNRKGALEGEIARIEKALEALNEHHHEDSKAKCPTCEQTLKDPEVLVSSLNKSSTSSQGELSETLSKLEELNTSAENIRNHYQRITSEKERLAGLEKALEDEEKQLSTASQAVSEQEDKISNIKASFAELPLPEELNERLNTLESRMTTLKQESEKIEAANSAAEELEDLMAVRVQREQERLAIEKQLNNLPSDDTSLEQREKDLEAANNQLFNSQALVQQLEYSIATLESEIARSEDNLSEAQKQKDIREAAAKDLEIKTAAAQSLADFRTDRLARLTPELSEVATDFVARMTDGKYTSVMLDDEFTPVLTDKDGQERPVAWLSGGEESAVALALRVAIGEVLAGQRGGLLILDEVLTAQDPSRRQATMNAIKALPRQIVTINHVSEATDMVDLVANIVATEDMGSAIEEWAPDSLAGSLDDLE